MSNCFVVVGDCTVVLALVNIRDAAVVIHFGLVPAGQVTGLDRLRAVKDCEIRRDVGSRERRLVTVFGVWYWRSQGRSAPADCQNGDEYDAFHGTPLGHRTGIFQMLLNRPHE